jgi:hypothetical protein
VVVVVVGARVVDEAVAAVVVTAVDVDDGD